ncbi:phosphoenolpyruvate synthase [Candidatus Parcubacteria bacterium]|nr:phosphoenolpyruvate synthase [Candidatus Parcubacteria bacterium]
MKNIYWFNQLTKNDVPLVGGKNASLGEMYQNLSKKGVRIPNGFATTADAYNRFLEGSGVKKEIKKILSDLNVHNIKNLMEHGAKVRNVILKAEFPEDLKKDIITSYKTLSKKYGVDNTDVAVRSSATAEDLPDASFAGQQETFLNIVGEEELLIAVKKCIASLFTNRAISYREDKGFDHFSIALSVGVQKMVRADLGSSGVMFTIDTESGFQNIVLVHSIYGLGENIVQGRVTPDEFLYFKPTESIISKTVSDKDIKMIYNNDKKKPVKNIKVADNKRMKQSITDEQAKQLAHWGVIVEKHYGRPMDMEWALDGRDGQLYIVQARPETVQSMRDPNFIENYVLKEKGEVLFTGQSVGQKIGSGVVNRIMDVKDIVKFKKGQVLVTSMTDPDWEPIMKIASAIVTDKGGRVCHAAIVSRELGIPCIVGTETGSNILKSGQKVTANCAEGETGKIHKGILKFEIKKTNVGKLKETKVKIMMNIGEPDLAFSNSFIPNSGVGLARLEFIINNTIKIHPMALINFSKQDAKTKKEIEKITQGYKDKKEFFVDKLSEGVGKITAAFYPKPVIVRLSDFKSNEYANLIGGRQYEPVESNPMIGWRGANRYYSPEFLPAFELECRALKKVREEMGLTNMKIMVPFCRTVEEGKKVLDIMAKNGLKRGTTFSNKNGQDRLEVYVMAEIPSNIILAEQFAEIFDGFSIGSNDLTQLTLGIDRDASGTLEVAGVSNEKNEAVKILIADLIKKAKKTKTKVGICGQAPSDFPDFVEFLVACDIDSISVIPDTVIKTTMTVAGKEKASKNKK